MTLREGQQRSCHDGGGWAKAVQRSTLEVCSGGTTNTDVMAASRSDRSGGTTGGHPRQASARQVRPRRGLSPTSPSRPLKPVVGGRRRGHDGGGWAKAVQRSTLEVCSGGTTNTDVMAASRSDRSGGTTGGHPRQASARQVRPRRGLSPTSPSRPLKPVVGGRLRGHDVGGWAKAVERSTLEVCSGGTTNTDVMAASRSDRSGGTTGGHPRRASVQQVFPWRGLAPTSPSRPLKPVVGGRLRGHDGGGWAKAVQRSTLEVCSGGTTNTDVMAASRHAIVPEERQAATHGEHPHNRSFRGAAYRQHRHHAF